MKEKNKSIDYKISDMNITNSCSATDCTGLIPTMPISESEVKSYQDIYQFEPPEYTAQKNKTKK